MTTVHPDQWAQAEVSFWMRIRVPSRYGGHDEFNLTIEQARMLANTIRDNINTIPGPVYQTMPAVRITTRAEPAVDYDTEPVRQPVV